MQTQGKRIGYSMLILFVALSSGILSTRATSSQYSRLIQTTGVIDYSSFKIGIYVTSWNFNEYNAGTIAETFDMSQSWWVDPSDTGNQYDAKMDQVHALNPNYKFLLYRDCMSVHYDDEIAYAESQGWLLKDINSNYVTEASWPDNKMVDITNKSYQQWLGAKVKSWLDQHPSFDGVMADNSLKYYAHEFDWGCSSRPINPQTGTYFTDQEILDGCAGVLNAIIDAIGSNKLVVANGIWSGFVWNSSQGDGYRYILSKVPRLNGLSSEGCFNPFGNQWLSETDWLSSVNLVSWIQDNFLNEPERYFEATCRADSNSLPSGATTQQMMIYGFSSMLLSTKYSSPQNTIYFGVDYSNSAEYPTELQLVQKLRSLDMIEPLGDYYKITSTSVYARDFVKGKVLVNPSGVSYAVTLDRSYTTFDGSTVSGSLTVYAHSGVILLK